MAAASVQQGLICLLLLLPAGLLTRHWKSLGGAGLGALLGLVLVHLLHPPAADPLRGIVAEAWVYLTGKVLEETTRIHRDYASTWGHWTRGALSAPPARVGLALGLGLMGLGRGAAQVQLGPRPRDGRRARLWPPGPEPGRAAVLGLLVAVLPLGVLVAVRASRHHLAQLLPLGLVCVGLGLGRALPGPAAAAGAGLLLWMAVPTVRRESGAERLRLETQARLAAQEADLVAALGSEVGPDS